MPAHDLLDLGDLAVHLRQAAVVFVGDQPAEALLVRGGVRVRMRKPPEVLLVRAGLTLGSR